MSTSPIKEAVPRISRHLTLLVYVRLDAHDDTRRLAASARPVGISVGGANDAADLR